VVDGSVGGTESRFIRIKTNGEQAELEPRQHQDQDIQPLGTRSTSFGANQARAIPPGTPRMSRRNTILIAVVAILVVGLIAFANLNSIQISYHQWRMNSAYNTLFGDPQPAGKGLASHDVTGIDVDSVMNTYEMHRQSLVELNVLHHVKADFPKLASHGTPEISELRSEFVNRMWRNFPGHKHYYLADDGSFETWIPIDSKNEWDKFIDAERVDSTTVSEDENNP